MNQSKWFYEQLKEDTEKTVKESSAYGTLLAGTLRE